ncbi:hypothetical protein [Photobacterium rosenbergii]|uniref:Cytochrome C n=1 Tax=Photobacterium rosenbergii TaxID=294936 RepID=A0ABU3ZJV7_9GAMM|nr:hypothetical protein [Photobacterium rosenbergii]MDV5170188.1 hypothetical protein [Photobacterium rosenbergii]
MKHIMTKICLLGALLLVSNHTVAYQSPSAKELHKIRFQYQMFCQGCHVADGRGGKDVPDMRDHIGAFLTIPEGRRYLIQVPGSANSAVNDADLANLMNWMVKEFGGDSAPDGFARFTSEEVGELRKSPLMEVTEYRKMLIQKIALNNGKATEESE